MFKEFIDGEKRKPYFNLLNQRINDFRKNNNVFPKEEEIFNALILTTFNNLKVVLIGQDPYHGVNQAHGLAFSVKKETKIPPSLRNIYKELTYEYGYEMPNHGNLESWAKQGVLLLNTILTVNENNPLSHKDIGWEIFINNLFELLQTKNNVVYLLLGNYAKRFRSKILNDTSYVLETSHPSPLSFNKGFYQSNIFKKVNKILEENNITPINWEIK